MGDALDRSHKESIHALKVDLSNPGEVKIQVQASEEELELEREGIKLKSDLFLQMFKKKVVLEARP